MIRWLRRLLVAAVVVGAAACGAQGSPAKPGGPGTITVFAAASLTESFTEIGAAFEAGYPGAEVRFNFASSADLVNQINEGAPVDVFASADQATMARVATAGNPAPAVFATNRLEILVAAGNPAGVTGLGDLADPDLVVVTASPGVPIGRYAAEVLAKAGVTVTPKSLEANVKAIVNKVVLGEADAGIVYATDVIAAGARAEGVSIPAELNVVAAYPMVILADAPNRGGAALFSAFVLGEQGQAILAGYGFNP